MRTVGDLMTTDIQTVDPSSTVEKAAQKMRDEDIGGIIVADDMGMRGFLTDRDIVVRVVAEGHDAAAVLVGDVCTLDVTALAADDDLHYAVKTLRDKSVRRLPVVDADNQPVGIVSIGDLAIELDRSSALADISAAKPNR